MVALTVIKLLYLAYEAQNPNCHEKHDSGNTPCYSIRCPEAVVCADKNTCQGCSLKLLEYLESELDNWEQLLKAGHIPDFKDLQKLEKTSKKIYKTLETNGLV